MNNYKAVFNLAQRVEAKIPAFRDILTRMPGVMVYNDPPLPYSDARTALDLLEARLSAAENGGALAKQELKDQTRIVDNIIKDYRTYVTLRSKGDRTLVLSSGFQASRDSSPVGALGQVVNLKSKLTGIPGEVKLRWSSLRGRQFYEVQVQGGTYNDWHPITTTRVNLLLTGLVSFQRYKVRVRACGAAGFGPFSDIIDFVVL
jgi:hypothetical protein